MKFSGFSNLTLTDFPGRLSSIVFTGGCNFKCPYCHNAEIAYSEEIEYRYDEEEILSLVEKRKKVVPNIVITGGEPTINSGLIPFMRKLKDIGISIKLDTNGYMPSVLESVIEENLVDYIAMDIKNSLELYEITVGIKNLDLERIKRSAEIIMDSNVEYEFRTTVVKELHSEESFYSIVHWLKNAKRYVLQSFVMSENVPNKSFTPPSEKDMEIYLGILKNNIENVSIRAN